MRILKAKSRVVQDFDFDFEGKIAGGEPVIEVGEGKIEGL